MLMVPIGVFALIADTVAKGDADFSREEIDDLTEFVVT